MSTCETFRIWVLSILDKLGIMPEDGPLFSSATCISNTVTVTFTNLTGSLQNQSDTNGWIVTDSNGERSIASATGTSDTVVLTLDQSPSPPVLVSFCPGGFCHGGAPSLADTGPPPRTPEPFANEEALLPWYDPQNEGLSIWGAYKPKDAESLVDSYVDLSGNGNDAVPNTAPTWNATDGWMFSSSQSLEVPFTPSQDRSQTVIVQYTNGGSGCICGAVHAAGGTFGLYASDNPGPTAKYGNGSGVISSASTHLSGNLCIGGQDGYKDGVFDVGYGGTLPYLGAMPSGFAIGAILISAFGIITDEWTGRMQAIAIYDEVLTSTQVANVATAMAAL